MFKQSIFQKLSLFGLGFTVFSPNLVHASDFQGVGFALKSAEFRYSIQDGALHCGTPAPSFTTPKICQIAPTSISMKEVAFGDYSRVACALTENGQAVCWSTDSADNTHQVSGLKNPHHLFFARYYACALDDDGLKCWSPIEDKAVVTLPDFKDATHLSPVGYGIYGLKQGKIIAADARSGEMFPAPLPLWDDLGPLTQLSVSAVAGYNYDNQGSFVCAIESGRAICTRTQNDKLAMGIRSDLSAPVRAIAAGPDISCALTPGGAKCWDSESGAPRPAFDRPELKNIRRLWMLQGDSAVACVETNESQIKCWNKYRDLDLN